MSEWRSGPADEDRARQWAQDGGHLFSTGHWGHVLEGLGCRARYAWNEGRGQGMLVPVFRKGPLSVGFLGFPVGAAALNGVDDVELEATARCLARQLGLDVVRTNKSVPAGESTGEGVRQPDAWIDDLAHWAESASKRRARDMAFARRATRALAFHQEGCSPAALHALYVSTVQAHGGNVRYTPGYFQRLVEQAERRGRLRVVHATDASGRLMGAAVLAMDGDCGYYLHAAVSTEARSLGLSDCLLSSLVATAGDEGMRRFGFMASPSAQQGLVKFKRKWADREGWVVTRDLGVGWLGSGATMALGLVGRWRRHRKEQE